MRLVLSLLVALFATTAMAGKIENWKNGEQLMYVDRAEDGRFKGYGELKLEGWNDDDATSEWIARNSKGEFVTGYKGKLEKFKADGKDKEAVRLVIRNKDGQFVTWQAMDDLLSAGFEKWSNQGWVYVVRYEGQLVNWSKANLEKWPNFKKPVLVVRDTADGTNNGKLMTWIPAEKVGNSYQYRDEKGRFISAN